MSNKNDHDIYIIPPNFIESGTFFGGMFRARNVIEAGILAFAIGVPVFMFVPFGLTTRIIILCLTALPAALVALIGISGESLSEFLIIFLKYLRNRRIVGGDGQQPNEQAPPADISSRGLRKKRSLGLRSAGVPVNRIFQLSLTRFAVTRFVRSSGPRKSRRKNFRPKKRRKNPTSVRRRHVRPSAPLISKSSRPPA